MRKVSPPSSDLVKPLAATKERVGREGRVSCSSPARSKEGRAGGSRGSSPTKTREGRVGCTSPTRFKEGSVVCSTPARTKSQSHTSACSNSPHNHADNIRSRWAGYKKVPRTPPAKTLTKIPRVPPGAAGKENRPRPSAPVLTAPRTARVVKPVIRPTRLLKDPAAPPTRDQLEVTDRVQATSPVPTSGAPPVRSPNYISSKMVPNLHNKFLAKIRSNKMRSRESSALHSPCKAPPSPSPRRTEEVDSPESNIEAGELEQYLRFMFSAVDQYKTGRVPAAALLEYLTNLVDMPRLDKWKLEELSRLLDPTRDNRYVDLELWFSVGKDWVVMMLDPDNHASSGGEEVEQKEEVETTGEEVETASEEVDISFGSVEGVGGHPGCSSREVELENKVSELSYQLARLGEENTGLQRAYSTIEDISANLTIDLEISKRKMASMTSQRDRVEIIRSQGEQVELVKELGREAEEKCCDLAAKVEHLLRENCGKGDRLREVEQELSNCKGEVEDIGRREEVALFEMKKFKEDSIALKKVVSEKDEELAKERITREKLESELADKTGQITGLEEEMAVKEEELRSSQVFRESQVREGSVGSSASSNLSGSMIHDMSVDDRIIEELHTNKPELMTPLRRGPSASSTPQKGNIGEELKEIEKSESGEFLSPLCEKIEKTLPCPKSDLVRAQERLAECLRKLLCDQVDQSKTGRLMAALNKALASNRKEVETYLEELVTVKELKETKERLEDIKKANAENMENKETETAGKEQLVVLEGKVSEMVSVLQTANEALLASSEMTGEFNLEPEVDLSSWQLDLEGIQLVDWNQQQLTRRLLNYSRRVEGDNSCAKLTADEISSAKFTAGDLSCAKLTAADMRCAKLAPGLNISCAKLLTPGRDASCLKQNLSVDVSRLVTGPQSRLWLSLFKKLEDLHTQAEVSRDLLSLAGDSIRTEASLVNQHSRLQDNSVNRVQDTSVNLFPKTIYCQTEQISTCQAQVQTDEQEEAGRGEVCRMEDCSCPASRARGQGRGWRFLLRLLGLLVIILLVFTFCCGLEVDHSPYHPVSWYYLRRYVGDQLPKPLVLLSYNSGPGRQVY